MGGFMGVAAKQDCVFDLYFGIDYHSHLGTRRGGMVVYDKEKGFDRSIHNIENAPFRTKFDKDMQSMKGKFGIGCISDYEPQPLIVRSHHGTYAITTVSKINNTDELVAEIFEKGGSHFLEMSGGEINATELIATLINQKENLVDGISYALEKVDGSVSLLLMNKNGIYCARDKYGRTPVVIGKKEDAFCVAFECFSYKNLGYNDYKELGPGEITVITDQNCITLKKPGDKMKICTFLWVYYGYPASSYEGTSVEQMRYNCGAKMAERDSVKPDIVAGVPDSGIAHAVGYANASGIPFSRPFIKYTPTWPRSFMPTIQSQRNLIAKMKLLAVEDLIRGKSLLLIDDSIVRGTQLRETTEYLLKAVQKRFISDLRVLRLYTAVSILTSQDHLLKWISSQDELLKDLRTAMLQTKFFRNTQIPILKNTSRWLMKSVKNSSSHPCVLTGLTICLIPAELTNANSVLIVGTVRNN